MKVLRYNQLFEDAVADAGSSTGMGAVVAAQPGSLPGQFGTDGSGDIGRPLNSEPFTKQPIMSYSNNISSKKKSKKKTTKKIKQVKTLTYDDFVNLSKQQQQ